MIKNYLKIAIRNLSYSVLVNLIGLSVGLGISVYLLIYVQQQLAFDDYHSKNSSIYRVLNTLSHSTGVSQMKEISTRQSSSIDENLSFVQYATNISVKEKVVVKVHENIFYEDQFLKADSNFFRVFDFELLEGDRNTVLSSPDRVIISSAIANKYFGDGPVLGEIITVDNKPYEVEAIIKKTKNNSHLDINILASNSHEMDRSGWWLTKYFVSTSDNIQDMENHINELFTEESDKPFHLRVQPLADIHLHTDAALRDFTTNADVTYLYTLVSIACLILITVCFNHANLSLAKYLRRAKEVGMRKIQGASRRQIILQLIAETFFFVFIALILGGLMLEVSLPYLNSWIQYEVILHYTSIEIISTFAIVLLIVTITAGYYPARYITSFSPQVSLSSQANKQHSKIGLIKILVATQFVISTILLSGAVIMQRQINYMNKKDLGVSPEGIIALNTEGKIDQLQYEKLKRGLLALPQIKQVAAGSMPDRTMTTTIKNRHAETFDIHITYILDDYIDLLNIELLQGRNFDFENNSDPGKRVIVNQEALELLDLENNGIGEFFSYRELDLKTFMSVEKKVEVIGVIRDFHYGSLKNKIGPLFLEISKAKGLKEQLGIRFEGADAKQIVTVISKLWKDLDTGEPLSYTFLTDEYENFHASENRLATGFSYISYLAIALSALGLFGLSNLEVRGNYKTISIKKVLGASITLISKQYLTSYLALSLMAGAIGLSISWWFMADWLNSFNYKFPIDLTTVLLPILAVFGIATVSVFYNIRTAAGVNPVENLRKD